MASPGARIVFITPESNSDAADATALGSPDTSSGTFISAATPDLRADDHPPHARGVRYISGIPSLSRSRFAPPF